MQSKLAARLNGASNRIEYIPNWANDEIVATPAHAPETRPFVVQYSGNMGVTHGIETLIESACLLLHDDSIRIELIGWGLKLPLVATEIRKRGLRNVTLLPAAPRAQLGEQLARCDVALIIMVPGASGASVPCRLYNIMAAGRPVIVAADADSEIASVVRDNRLGWVVAPAAPEQLASAIREACLQPEQLKAMGDRARELAHRLYRFERAAVAYQDVIASVSAAPSHHGAA